MTKPLRTKKRSTPSPPLATSGRRGSQDQVQVFPGVKLKWKHTTHAAATIRSPVSDRISPPGAVVDDPVATESAPMSTEGSRSRSPFPVPTPPGRTHPSLATAQVPHVTAGELDRALR